MAENPAILIGLRAGAEQKTALSQIGLATFGEALPFYLLQGFTAAILILAANTAFNGFPVLSSLLGRDNYLPHQLSNRGDRLVFSNGIVLLALVAGLLIVAFDADVTRLIQLYILGVFLSFTLSQAGMVRHWARELDEAAPTQSARRCGASRPSTPLGAVATGLVFVIVLVTKFAQGAWIVVLAAPLLFLVMKAITAHYGSSADRLAPDRLRRRAARPDSRGRPGLEPAGADAARARLRRRRRARPRCAPSGSQPTRSMTRFRASGSGAEFRFRSSSSSRPTARPSARCFATCASCGASTPATSSRS